MTNYAYLDKYGILHISSDIKTAKTYAKLNGKVRETELETKGGYPTFTTTVNGEEVTNNVIAYAVDDIKVDSKVVNPSNYKGIVALYKELS